MGRGRRPAGLDGAAAAEIERERVVYMAHIRRSTERLAFAVAGFFALTAALPLTRPEDRAGVLVTAVALVGLILLWFHVVPPRLLGERRVMAFSILVQPVATLLLLTTGGIASDYLLYLNLVVLVTVYSPDARDTVLVAAVTALNIVAVGLGAPHTPSAGEIATTSSHVLGVIAFALFTVMVGGSLRSARRKETLRAAELSRAERRAQELAITDALTGLYNRRHGNVILDRLVAEARRGRPFSVLALDVDRMKQINDEGGHAAGDAALIRIAEIMRTCLRTIDVPIRSGGDEFIAFLPNTDAATAARVASRIRAEIERRNAEAGEAPVRASIGVAEWKPGASADEALHAADSALYAAKRERAERGGVATSVA